MDRSLAQFVRTLYFDMQTVENVKPLEIWNGIRERNDPFEAASLAKNLLKITVPLVNERCSGKPFGAHARMARQALGALLGLFRQDSVGQIQQRFPDPPTGDDGQKELYRAVRETVKSVVERLGSEVDAAPADAAQPSDQGLLPDGLFDFREMRIVDNELPFIIFTEKEYRVIHGIAIVYMWLIQADEILLEVLERAKATAKLAEEYRQFAKRVQSEKPLSIKGKYVDARAFASRIHEKLKDKDYLDIFEEVHRWFEQARSAYLA